MPTDETDTNDAGESTDEFYVPATFQFSKGAGQIERVLVGLFDEDGELEVRTVGEDEPTPEFYVPAMFQFSEKAGRVERFLQRFKQSDDQQPPEIPEEFRDDFYLPGSNPDDHKPPRE